MTEVSSSEHENTASQGEEQTDSAAANLTKKKQEYLEQTINDKNGVFKYDEDPNMYKKARKRLQNRESAVRSRTKKKEELETLEE